MTIDDLLQTVPGTSLDGLSLKGSRDYLHSTDIWNEFGKLVSTTGATDLQMSMSFRRITARKLRIDRAEFASPENRYADVRLRSRDQQIDLVLSELADVVTARIACPEESILPDIELSPDEASVPVKSHGTPVERLVAATKKLHLTQVDGGVRWLVGRLELPVPFTTAGTIGVRIRRRLPRSATVSDVFLEGDRVGAIYFNPVRQG